MRDYEKMAVAKLQMQRDELLKACKATILFYRVGPWDAEARAEWKRLTGSDDRMTKTLCDTCRAAIAKVVAEGGT